MQARVGHIRRSCRSFATSLARRSDRRDVIVIGGGSGGLACAREAASLGLSATVLDWVEPSPAGTTWGIGGTCVNVGCVPKKLFHHAAQLADSFREAQAFGWQTDSPPRHSWEQLVNHVQGHVQGASFGYMSALLKEGVESVNARGHVAGWDADLNAVRVLHATPEGVKAELLASNVVVAVGTRPRPLEVLQRLGRNFAAGRVISSDDLFSMRRVPGRTLVLGGGYVALECAGFLQSLGQPTTIANRSGTFLRGFDRDCADSIVSDLETRGVQVLRGWELGGLHMADVVPKADTDGRGTIVATLEHTDACARSTADARHGSASRDMSDGRCDMELEVDTVLVATGRIPQGLGSLGVDGLGAQLHASGKLLGGAGGMAERISSSAPLYAVGDVLHGLPELTPVAIAQGVRVARTIAAAKRNRSVTSATPRGDSKAQSSAGKHSGPVPLALRDEWAVAVPPPLEALTVPTAVFTPLEYACVGLGEEEARDQHGDGNVDVVWARFDTLEQQLVSQVNWQPDAKVCQGADCPVCIWACFACCIGCSG